MECRSLLSSAFISATLARRDLTSYQKNTLMALALAPEGLATPRLAEATGVTPVGASRAADVLVARKLAFKTPTTYERGSRIGFRYELTQETKDAAK